MRHQPPTFTKEKAAFLLVALFCAALLYAFVASRPTELQPGPPLAFSKKDPALLNFPPQELRTESAYFSGKRKSPFLPTMDIAPPPDGPNGPNEPSEPTGPNGPRQGGNPANGPISPERFYEFAGVVVHGGSAHALLQVRGKPVTIRAEAGAILDGGYSVTRVNKQSIELRHANGQRYLLRDRPE